MSGDVQPRKRKEKRRKKDAEYTIRRISSVSLDEDDSGTPPPPLVHAAEHASDHINLHIYKESSTGGHWCARIVFFILLAVLVGLIGLIIFEHRGTTDVDTPIESSQWAFVFDGWVDDSTPSHDEEPHEEEEDHEGVSEEIEDDELDHEDKANENDEEEHSNEGEVEASQEEEGADEEEEEEEEDATLGYEEEEDEDHDDEDVDENVSEDGNEENEDEEEIDEPEEDEGEEEEENQSTQEGENVSTEMDSQLEEEDIEANGGDLDFDDAGVLEELNIASEENTEDVDDDTLDDRDDEFDDNDDIDDGSEELKPAKMPAVFLGIPGVNELDDDGLEPLEEVEGIEPEEVTEQNLEPEIEEEIEEESASVPVKFGVGVALVVAAHFVLIRRWNNVDLEASDFTGSPDLSRRTTIVPPPSTKEAHKVAVKNETELSTDKKSRNYETLRAKYNQLSTDNTSKNVPLGKSATNGQSVEKAVTTAKEAANVKAQAQSKVFSSEEEEDEGEELETSDAERLSGEEEYDYEGDEYDDEVGEEAAEDEEEEIENIDDSELIAKLEAKYGKLPTPQDSEEEVEEELEEEEEEEEEDDEEMEDEDMEGWKRVNVPKHLGESRSPQKSGQADTTKNVGGGAISHSSNRSRIDNA